VFHFIEFINSVILSTTTTTTTTTTKPTSTSPTAPLDCPADNPDDTWLHDGQCDDATNTPECGFDGGDCCVENVNTDHCTKCQCLTSGTEPPIPTTTSTTTSTLTTASPDCIRESWVGDGFCDDATNTPECRFDGGDCCGVNANKRHCTKCKCFASPDCFDDSWVGDGVCDDATNTPECKFDGGDCCGKYVEPGECTKCQCLTSDIDFK
jgi:hypothetical protein